MKLDVSCKRKKYVGSVRRKYVSCEKKICELCEKEMCGFCEKKIWVKECEYLIGMVSLGGCKHKLDNKIL